MDAGNVSVAVPENVDVVCAFVVDVAVTVGNVANDAAENVVVLNETAELTVENCSVDVALSVVVVSGSAVVVVVVVTGVAVELSVSADCVVSMSLSELLQTKGSESHTCALAEK